MCRYIPLNRFRSQMTDNQSLSTRLKNLDRRPRIALIGAMDQEIDLLKSSLENCQASNIAGYAFYHGMLHGAEVGLLKSGIGKVNAAIGTTLLLSSFNPDCVINTGSAGGLDPDLAVGDVVISSEVRHHDVDVTSFGYEMGQMPGFPPAFLPDPLLVDVATDSIRNVDGVQTVHGLIATGDSFMSCEERVAEIRRHFPELKAVEMEAAAIAQTCYQFGVPFIIIRALSDIAGKESNLSFKSFLEIAATHSAKMVSDMVETLVNKASTTS